MPTGAPGFSFDKVNLLNSTNFTQGKAVIIIVMWHYFLLLPSLPLRAIALFHVWLEKKKMQCSAAVVVNPARHKKVAIIFFQTL